MSKSESYVALNLRQKGSASPDGSPVSAPTTKASNFFTDNDRERHKLLDTVLNNEELLPEDVANPQHAMKQMLQHVTVDPDGGILNIVGDSKGSGRHQQHSKVQALRKGKLESMLAIFAVFRTIANPVMVTFFASKTLYGIWMGESWVQKLRDQTAGMRLPLPFMELFVITSALELLGLAIILALVMRYAAAWCCHAPPVPDRVHPKYLALAELYWHYLPYLQTFSALAPLALIHPNLLTKNLKSFSMREDLARAKLERFLAKEANTMNDNQIVGKVIGAMFHDEMDSEDRRAKASEYLESSPYKVLKLLQGSSMAQDKSYLQGKGYDPNAIFGCRYSCVLWCEFFTLCAGGFLCLLAGSVAFLCKIARTFCMFIDEEKHIVYPICFFFMFLNQCVGIVPLSRLLTWRIETFMFGGPDAQASTEELFVMRFYLGCLVEAVWKSQDLSWFAKMCVMFQLDDDDLQQLVIEDASAKKAMLLLQIRQYMHETRQVNWLKTKIISMSK